MQLDHPDTFWKCAFCPEERSTLLVLTAYINESHEGQLFQFECGKFDFQAEGPRLLRKQQVEAHETDILRAAEPNIVRTAKPAAGNNTEMAGQVEQPQKTSLHEDPVACSKDSYRNRRNTDSLQFWKSETGRDIKKLF